VYSKSKSCSARLRSYTSRSNGDNSAVRPSKSSPSAASTRHAPFRALHHGRLAGLADVDWLERYCRALLPGDPERAEPALITSG
jgi:hypothetical protein